MKIKDLETKLKDIYSECDTYVGYASDGRDCGCSVKGELTDVLAGLHELILAVCETNDEITPDIILGLLWECMTESSGNLPKCDTGVSSYMSNGKVNVELEGSYEEVMFIMGVLARTLELHYGVDVNTMSKDMIVASNLIQDLSHKEGGPLC